jgi:hypothetical protein
MNICLHCKKETSNPKFCSRSCAACINNTIRPKRKPEGACKTCKKPNTTNRTYCHSCWIKKRKLNSIQRWETETLKAVRGIGNANAGGRYPMLRNMSRKKYIKSGRPMTCFECGYSKHVDICHIKEIKSFSEDSFVSEINDLDNLIALCKNHHWELDNGFMTLKSAALSN